MTPDKLKYLCFSTDTSPDLARARFGERFGGAQPEKVYVQAGMLWAGPVPGQESETMKRAPKRTAADILADAVRFYMHNGMSEAEAKLAAELWDRTGWSMDEMAQHFDKQRQAPLFDDVACLPLFSGTPVPGRLEVFDPPASQVQACLPGFELKLKGT